MRYRTGMIKIIYLCYLSVRVKQASWVKANILLYDTVTFSRNQVFSENRYTLLRSVAD